MRPWSTPGLSGLGSGCGPTSAAAMFVQTGTLCVGGAGQGWIQDSADDAGAHGYRSHWNGSNREAMEKRFPLIHVRDDDQRILAAERRRAAGQLTIIEGLARYLIGAHGVPIRTKSRATAIDPNRATVRLADGRASRGRPAGHRRRPLGRPPADRHGPACDPLAAARRLCGAAGGPGRWPGAACPWCWTSIPPSASTWCRRSEPPA